MLVEVYSSSVFASLSNPFILFSTFSPFFFHPKDCVLLKDETIIYQIAKGLMKLQSLFGIIPHIVEFNGKEGLAEKVATILFRMRREVTGLVSGSI